MGKSKNALWRKISGLIFVISGNLKIITDVLYFGTEIPSTFGVLTIVLGILGDKCNITLTEKYIKCGCLDFLPEKRYYNIVILSIHF